MGLYKRGQTWWFRFQWHGREYRRSTNLDAVSSNETAALKLERDFRIDLEAGRGKTARRTAFAEAAKGFLSWCTHTEYRSKPATAKRIAGSFDSLKAWFRNSPVSEIDAEAVQNYKQWRAETHQVRDSTLRNDLWNLSLFFRKWAIPRKQALLNPVTEVSKPSGEQDEDAIYVLSRDDERAYFKSALKRSKTLHDLGRLMILTGARPEELLSAKKEHFNLERKILRIAGGKTRSARRDLPLVKEAVTILMWRKQSNPKSIWIFPSPRKPGCHVANVNTAHEDATLDSEISFRLYDLRHTWATRMITEAKVDLATVAALLGHSGLTMVRRYVHPQADVQKAAIQALEELESRHKRSARKKTGTR